ncbi:hypothetical protein FHR53_003045 [Xanthomonas arboricola]
MSCTDSRSLAQGFQGLVPNTRTSAPSKSSRPRTCNAAAPLDCRPAARHGTLAAMPSLILFMIAGAALFAFWNSSRAAAERADILGRNACRAADVQWLDQSVHSTNIRICRMPNGWLGFERTFRFEYSYDGADRHSGKLVLRGDQLIAFTGPQVATVRALHPEQERLE